MPLNDTRRLVKRRSEQALEERLVGRVDFMPALSWYSTRGFQYHACRHQASLVAGMIFQGTKQATTDHLVSGSLFG